MLAKLVPARLKPFAGEIRLEVFLPSKSQACDCSSDGMPTGAAQDSVSNTSEGIVSGVLGVGVAVALVGDDVLVDVGAGVFVGGGVFVDVGARVSVGDLVAVGVRVLVGDTVGFGVPTTLTGFAFLGFVVGTAVPVTSAVIV